MLCNLGVSFLSLSYSVAAPALTSAPPLQRGNDAPATAAHLALRPRDAVGPPWVVVTAGDDEVEQVLLAAAREKQTTAAPAEHEAAGAAPKRRAFQPDAARARQSDLETLALGYVALLYSRVTCV